MARVIRGDGAAVIPGEVQSAKEEAARILDAARARVAEDIARVRSEERDRARTELAAEHVRVSESVQQELARLVPELAVAVARKILDRALDLEPDRIRDLAGQALSRVPRAREVRVFVRPEDVSRLEGISARVVEDRSLSAGDVVVSSELGDVDARLSVRLDALLEALRRNG